MPELISPLELSQEETPPDVPQTTPDVDLEAIRELVLRAHPDVVPELVTGDSVSGLLASVEPARSAYARLAETLAARSSHTVPVPAGGGAPLPVDPAKLPAAEKIRRGLQATSRRIPKEG